MRFVVCVAVLLVACKNDQPPVAPQAAPTTPPPPSGAVDNRALVDQVVAAAYPTCDPAKLAALFDVTAFTKRVIDHAGSNGAQLGVGMAFVLTPEKVGEMLCTWVGGGEQLRVVTGAAGVPLVRRLLRSPRTKAFAAQYIRLEVVAGAAGAKIVDLYSYVAGQSLSDAMVEFASTQLGHGMASAVASTTAVRRARDLQRQGKRVEALAALDELSPEANATRPIQMMRVGVAEGISAAAYTHALEELVRRFPNDPTVAFVEIDGALLHHDYDGALRYVDLVEQEVGKDGFQEAIRAKIYQLRQASGDLALALETVDAAIKTEPTLGKPWYVKLDVELALKDWASAIEVMNHLESSFRVKFTDELLAKPDFAGLVASREFGEWRKQHLAP